MPAFQTIARVGPHGELHLDRLPFEPGEKVEVLIVSRRQAEPQPGSLAGSVVEYLRPLEPVVPSDWDATR